MKKTFKIILVSLLIIGIVAVVIGVILGGSTSMNISMDGISFSTANKVEMVEENISDTVKEIYIDIDLSENISVIVGDKFSVSYDKAQYTLKQDENEIIISQTSKGVSMTFGFNYHNDFEPIIITVPEKVVLDRLEANINLCGLEINGISAKVLDIDIDTGNVELKNVIINQINIEGGLSDVNMYDCVFQESIESKIDVGEMKLIDCVINNSSDFDINLGDLTLDLIGNKYDYIIKTDINLGTFKFDGIKSDVAHLFGNGNKQMNINLDTGSCYLSFSDK